MPEAELERLWGRSEVPLSLPPAAPAGVSPLVLPRVHWVRPEMVAEVIYAEWTQDGLLGHVVHLGERGDKAASKVVRERPSA